MRTSAAASAISLRRTSPRCSAASVRDARRGGGGSVRLVSLEYLEVVAAPIREVAARERVPLEPGRRFFAAIHPQVQLVGHRVTASLVLPALNRGTVVTGDGASERMPLSREPADVVRDACVGVAGRADHRRAVVFAVARAQAIGVPARVEVPVSAGRLDHRGGEVLPAPSDAGEWGASFRSAATVGSLWRATPQTGQRLRCAEFSWYGPSGFRQLQCHSPGFSLIRRLGWTFELNTTKRPFLSR